ncbi:MAG: polar amino acid transport system substrate-binding protein [Cellvibrionaceae bacterium]|jgi:polar amino acid transport system substrate-binding protein
MTFISLTTRHCVHLKLLLLSAFLFATPFAYADRWSVDGRPIIVGGDYNFPPYEYIDKKGSPVGYNVELTLAIADVMGLSIEIRLGDWDDMIGALNTGEVDVLQGIVASEERKKKFSFSSAHAIIHHSVFARKGTPAPEGLSGLENKAVMVQNKSIMHEYLLQNKVNANIFPVTAHVDALRSLASGEHDYALVANLPGLYLGKEFGLSNLVLVGKPFSSQRYGYGVLRGNESLVAIFSEGLAILKNTGRQQAIYDRWLGVLEREQALPWQQLGLWAVLISILLLFVTAVVMFWNHALRTQVDKRKVELGQQQQQLLQADKMASLGVLVSGVAHEINNPTGSLLLNLPLINDAWRDSQVILESHYQKVGDFEMAGLKYSRLRDELPIVLDEMTCGATRIKRIVEDLKDFARHDAVGNDTLVDINDVVATAIRLVDTSIRKSTHHFIAEYDKNLPLVSVNAQRIEQIIINLVLNACQALTDLGQKVSVSTSYNKVQKKVIITVADEGSGIEEDNLTKLTDPFFTTKRDHGGTGLGLSVSAGIAKAYGGKLLFASQKNVGTRVCLELPASNN